jgi:hypothetical protein
MQRLMSAQIEARASRSGEFPECFILFCFETWFLDEVDQKSWILVRKGIFCVFL